MKDTTPEGIMGYVVVSLPDRGVWQGFFVHPAYKARGEQMMATFREAMASAGQRPLPGEEGVGGLPHLASADQPAVAALSAVLAQLVDRGEPPRVCRRLQLLRGWSDAEQDDEQVFA